MRKVYFILLAVTLPAMLFAQIPNAGMDSWRTSPAGHTTVQAPISWYGSDSTVIGLGESALIAAFLGTTDADWNRQIFQESTNVHSAPYSAKIMTVYEDSFLVPGVITNAIPNVSFSLTPPGINAITLKGGTAATAKPTSVSAWVQYYAGKDSTGATGIDSGRLTVAALAHIGGKDSVIGTGTVTIGPSSSWVQITANVIYPADTVDAIDTFQISFSSGKSPVGLDSSTLYVDDISMTTVPNPDHSGVKIVSDNNLIKVYPNPANSIIYFDCPQNSEMNVALSAVNGQVVATRSLAGNDALDVSALPSGLYFYTVSDRNGSALQRGKVAISK